jgi:CRP/FNR family transcriptional regulator, cyclic AMP receptor protein
MTNDQPELLWGLPADESARLAAIGTRAHFASGATLFGLGADAETMYVLERGRIALTLPVQIGGRQEDVLVEERQAGQTVGWSALIPPHRFTLKATALVDTEAMAFTRTDLFAFFAASPLVGYAVTRNLAAVIGQRLQVFQAMWLREMQRVIDTRSA